MKKHMSVFMLAARFALLPALITTLLGAAASLLFLTRAHAASGFSFSMYDAIMWPEYVGIGLLMLALMRPMRESGGVQPGYTLMRLRVSELTAFCWQGVAGALSFFIFLMGQAAVCFGYGLYLQGLGEGPSGDMSLLVCLVSNEYTHALLPLGDLPVYLRMALVCLALGGAAAWSSYMGRRSKTAIAPVVLLAAAYFLYAFRAVVAAYGYELVCSAICAAVIVLLIVSVRSHAHDYGDDEEESAAGGVSIG